jgi:hypothetical protein
MSISALRLFELLPRHPSRLTRARMGLNWFNTLKDILPRN